MSQSTTPHAPRAARIAQDADPEVCTRVGPVVLLAGPAVPAALYAVRVAQRERRRDGLPPSRALDRLAGVLSPGGHEDMPAEPIDEPEPMMSTSEAAALLGVSRRQATRLAPQLDGRFTGGRWLIPSRTLDDHLEGSTP